MLGGSKHRMSEGYGEPGSRNIKLNMFSQILAINKYLIPVLAWQWLWCEHRSYFKTLIHFSYLIHILRTGVHECVCESEGEKTMSDEDCCHLRDKAPSEEFPENLILCVLLLCMRAFVTYNKNELTWAPPHYEQMENRDTFFHTLPFTIKISIFVQVPCSDYATFY